MSWTIRLMHPSKNRPNRGIKRRQNDRYPRLDEKTLVLVPNNTVALARGRLQAMAVDNRDPAMGVPDQPVGFQRTQRYRDPRPPYAQHHREKFVAEGQLVV